MSYRFSARKPVDVEFRAIALEQIALCHQAAQSGDVDVPHEIRKHCKRLRALLRLVRGSFSGHAREQRVVSQAADELALLRDIAAQRETLTRLRQRDPQRYGVHELELADTWLADQQRSEAATHAQAAAVQRALDLLDGQRHRVPDWTLQAKGFAALSDGLTHTYRQARRCLALALEEPTAEHFHELRKHAKHHRFHMELLQPLWKRPMQAAIEELELLGERLGEHHDLHVLATTLADASRGTEGLDPVWLKEFVRPEMRRLERRALYVARRAFAEKPSRFRARLGAYWQVQAKKGRRFAR
ncbi:CHAD domain-containing protein [Cognatilysobacter lacus]|nr:CHAD domain-containing protein [Lysobacter lacus]